MHDVHNNRRLPAKFITKKRNRFIHRLFFFFSSIHIERHIKTLFDFIDPVLYYIILTRFTGVVYTTAKYGSILWDHCMSQITYSTFFYLRPFNTKMSPSLMTPYNGIATNRTILFCIIACNHQMQERFILARNLIENIFSRKLLSKGIFFFFRSLNRFRVIRFVVMKFQNVRNCRKKKKI